MKPTGAELVAHGFAYVMTDVHADKQHFYCGDVAYTLPRGSVYVYEWRKTLVAKIADVRESAKRHNCPEIRL